MLSFHLGHPGGDFHSGPLQRPVYISLVHHVCHSLCSPHPLWYNLKNICWWVRWICCHSYMQEAKQMPFYNILLHVNWLKNVSLPVIWNSDCLIQKSVTPNTVECLFACTNSKKVYVEVNVKVKFTLEQAMKTQRGSRCIALLFLQP